MLLAAATAAVLAGLRQVPWRDGSTQDGGPAATSVPAEADAPVAVQPPSPLPVPPPWDPALAKGGGSAADAAAGRFVPDPGDVGFRGDEASLTVIDSADTAPEGTTWTDGYLTVDAADLTLDGVRVAGGIDFLGSGTLTIRNSVIEGGGSWMIVVGREPGCGIVVEDSTLRLMAGEQPWVGNGAGAVHGPCRTTLRRNDISGAADGVQVGASGSVMEQNVIHDLALTGTYPDNSHNDGIQAYTSDDLLIRYNRIEIGFDGEHQNAAVFLQGEFEQPAIVGNVLEGGGYFLRLEEGVREAIVTDNAFGPRGDAWGEALVAADAAAVWERNVTTAGTPVAPVQP